MNVHTRLVVSRIIFYSCILTFYGCVDRKMELAEFTSDGCSLFIDGTFENPDYGKMLS